MTPEYLPSPDNDPATPSALRLIAKRLESDDMVESIVLNGAADELERLRDFIDSIGDASGPYPYLDDSQIIIDAREVRR